MKKMRRARRTALGYREPTACRHIEQKSSASRTAPFTLLMLGVFGVCGFASVWAQQQGVPTLAGDWSGTLKIGTTSLSIVFHVTAAERGYSATMDSPDQGARGIPVSTVRFDGRNVTFEVAAVGGQYCGSLSENGESIAGSWKQSGLSLLLTLARQPQQRSQEPADTLQESAPQGARGADEPSPPFPYTAKDVDFSDERAGVRLAGTLTIPQGNGPFPGVVLVSGSGPQNRDEEVFGHKPFLVLSDYLTRRGIAVLRYDDRGVGGSTGSFQSATTFDFADDAQAALDFFASQPEIDPRRVGVIGHSEGAIVASIVAARAVPNVAFIVLLAGPGVRGDELLLMQNAALARASGLSDEQISQANRLNRELYSIAVSDEDEAARRKKIIKVLEVALGSLSGLTEKEKQAHEAQLQAQADQLLSPWMHTFLALDPSEYLREVGVPVLALGGSKDLQVPARENLAAIGKALKAAGNDRGTLIELEGLNHLFQHAGTGLPSEYGELRETFAPEALKQIGDWIIDVGVP